MSVGSSINYTTLVGAKTVDGSIAVGFLIMLQFNLLQIPIVCRGEAAIYPRFEALENDNVCNRTFIANPIDVANPVDYIPIFSDYLEDRVYFNHWYKLSENDAPKTMEKFIAAYGYDGSGYRVVQQPMWYFNDNTNIKFDSPPDQAYPYLLVLYQQPAALSVSNQIQIS